MDFDEEMEGLLKELQDEFHLLKQVGEPEAEKEVLQDILEIFANGLRRTQEQIDRFNDRRWRQ